MYILVKTAAFWCGYYLFGLLPISLQRLLRLLDTYLRVNDRSVMLGVDTAYCFVGLVAISVIGTPFFGLIPTVIL